MKKLINYMGGIAGLVCAAAMIVFLILAAVGVSYAFVGILHIICCY